MELLEGEIGKFVLPVTPIQAASEPKLVARFQEFEGELCKTLNKVDKVHSFAMDLWVESLPPLREQVSFERLDEGTEDRICKIKKKGNGAVRQFVTDEINLFGDVEIRARDIGSDTD